MSLELKIIPRVLHFKQPAGTSRGVYLDRKVWYIWLSDGLRMGIGECAPLPQLSCDYEAIQEWISSSENIRKLTDTLTKLVISSGDSALGNCIPRELPSLRFAVETALMHIRCNTLRMWDTPFSRGEIGIPINGLIWMGTYREMYDRIRAKIEAGFHCVKLKIGAIGFDEELSLLRYIRTHFNSEDIELRVDANGAFTAENAFEKLEQLSELQLHSIEQPIRAGQKEVMAFLCQTSPLPIAFDEELIGIHSQAGKRELLEQLHPQYIVLKPSLHGGIQGTREWITEAERLCIGWWITSALESNVGLNAIAQLCATYQPSFPQGLGTGQLFTDNIVSPLYLEGDSLKYDCTFDEKSFVSEMEMK